LFLPYEICQLALVFSDGPQIALETKERACHMLDQSLYFVIGVLILFPCFYFLSRLILGFLGSYLAFRKWIPPNVDMRQRFVKPMTGILFLIGLEIIIPFLDLQGKVLSHLQNLVQIMLIIFCAFALTRVIYLVKFSLFSRLDISRPDNLRERKMRTQFQFVEKLILGFLYFVAIALILMNFDGARRLGSSLIASAGLAGIVLGFAAQKSLGDLIAGFQIAFTQPIRIDDVVIVENEWGRIEEITFTYVVIRIWDKRTLVVPITYFLEKPFQNWTRATADLVGTVMIYVDYSMPLEPLRREFKRILENNPMWDGRIAGVQITDCTNTEMQVRFIMGARNASDSFDLRCSVRESLIVFVQRDFPRHFPEKRVNVTDK